MFDDDELLPLSGLQHLVFCERQWALIHIEQIWSENRLTAEGRELHDRAHEPGCDSRPGIRIARGLRLRSLRLGLAGQADVVEFRAAPFGARLPGEDGFWQPLPVEYKRGRPKSDRSDEVQLCAQAICLEEMFEAAISAGALFYGSPRRRHQVDFSASLRAQTESLAARMHELYRIRTTPRVSYSRQCDRCSLLASCIPKTLRDARAVERYLAHAIPEEFQ